MNVDYNPRPAIYASWYPAIREIAIRHGYEACIHGSLLKDMDVVLIPWEQRAADPIPMLVDMKNMLGVLLYYYHPIEIEGSLSYLPVMYPDKLEETKTPTPHGRESWSLRINGDLYVDIAIMPIVS